MQGYKGVEGAPVARLSTFGDPQEPKQKWLKSLKKQWEKWWVEVQTRNLEGLGGGEKGHRACRWVGGDWSKCAHMMRQKGQRESHLFWSLSELKPKSGKKSSFEETN